VIGLPVPNDVQAVFAEAEAMRRAFPGWLVHVQQYHRDKARIEVVSRTGRDPWVMISSDPAELWAELARKRR
jgi:hypothetical protein